MEARFFFPYYYLLIFIMKKIAVYGGSFSPPHIGHASVIEAVVRLFPCDELWVMPSADRADKLMSAGNEHRFQMTERMVRELFEQSRIPVIVSRYELDRPKHTLTYDTLKELEAKHPDCEFHFIISSELLHDMTRTWEKGLELFEEGRFAIVQRPGTMMSDRLPPHSEVIDNAFAWIDVSSTFIRKLISSGLTGTPYLTPQVAAYIREQKLFKDK
jgi:nicotinate-nucleotide adenylyltransferase